MFVLILKAVRDLQNAEKRIKDLEKDNKGWEEQVNRCAPSLKTFLSPFIIIEEAFITPFDFRLVMDLKIAYDLHKDDEAKQKEAKKIVAKHEQEVSDLRDEIENWRQRFAELEDHVKFIDTLKG